MKKIIGILFFTLSSSLALFAQDPTFSQPYSNPLYLNPAFAGTGTTQRIGLNFRDEWPAIPGNYVTYGFSYDRNVLDSSFGVGFIGMQDRAGQNTLITTSAGLIASYQFHIKSVTLSVGAQGSFGQKSVSESNLNFGSAIDPRRGFTNNTASLLQTTKVSYADFDAGLLGYGKYYFAGFAIDHITQPNESFASGTSPLPIKLVFNAGGVIPIGSFTIYPTLLYQKQQDFSNTMVDCYGNWKWLTIGLGCRFDDALVFTAGFQNKFLHIGYSYDYTVSKLTIATGGSHEVSLAVLLKYKSAKLKKVNGINCPAF